MNTFVKIPASKKSISSRRLRYEVAINDAWYMTSATIQGVRHVCPVYRKWTNMLERCYSSSLHKKHPAYIGCTVVKEWYKFSNFEAWFNEHNIEGYDLDKDLKIKGNKVYGPDTCLFVSRNVNTLFINKQLSKNGLPRGVSLHNKTGKFQAKVRYDGKRKHLGLFTTPELARAAYVIAKNEEIMRKCGQYPELKEYLLAHLEK